MQGAPGPSRLHRAPAGRPVVFIMCEWGTAKPRLWAKDVSHLWRTTGDVYPCFDCIVDHGTWKQWGVLAILDLQHGLRSYAGPGHWNDPDMLEVWFKPLSNGDWAMAVLNRNPTPRTVASDWRNEAVSDSLSSRDAHFDSVNYRLRDLWTKKDAGTTRRALSATVPGYDVLMFRLVKQ
ncbi:MAG TPA: hypothetical protein VFL93_08870 [Longimicrobiaceae bacterium]|nr:hypothetical protein [Longimicrobiaceae bacterium]